MKAVSVPVVSVKQFLPELTTAMIPALRWLGGTVVFEICATPPENGVCFGVQFCPLSWGSASKIDPLNSGLLAACFGRSRWWGMLIVETLGRMRREHLVKVKSDQGDCARSEPLVLQ
jgi:hypothetical protein